MPTYYRLTMPKSGGRSIQARSHLVYRWITPRQRSCWIAWKNGQRWVGIKTHTGYNQEAYDAECAALTRVLETLQDDTKLQRGSQSSQTPRLPSGAWPRRSLAPVGCMQSRLGGTL